MDEELKKFIVYDLTRVVTDRIHINDNPIDTAIKWLNYEIDPTKTNHSDTWWSKTGTSIRTLDSKFHIKITFYRELEKIKLTRIKDRDDKRIKTLFHRTNINILTNHLHDAIACKYFSDWQKLKSQGIITDCFSRSGRSNKVMYDYRIYDHHYFF